jgi:HEPN domain
MNPQNSRRIPGSPEEWLSHAQSDLRLAHLGFKDPQIIRGQVCFHAQQAAEKAIKGVLLFRPRGAVGPTKQFEVTEESGENPYQKKP